MEQNKLVMLKLIGFNEVERNNIEAILSLAARALQKKWRIVESNEADFFLFAVGTSTATSDDEQIKQLPVERCLFCHKEKQPQSEHSLYVDNKHVPSLSSLVTLFNQVSSNNTTDIASSPSEATLMTSASDTKAQETSSACFDAQQGLLGGLLTKNNGLLSICLHDSPETPALYINAEKNIYYSLATLEQLNPYLIESPKLDIKSCTTTEIESYIADKNIRPQQLKNLIWYIAIKTSNGRILKGHDNSDIVTLKIWPDLKLFKCLDYAKFAAFMKNNAATLEIVSEYTKIALEEVIDFYNACSLMGIIEKRNQLEINKKSLSSERLELLNKIDARLKEE